MTTQDQVRMMTLNRVLDGALAGVEAADQLGVSVVGAGNLLRQLKRLDVVSEQRRGNGIATLWRARDVLAAVSD